MEWFQLPISLLAALSIGFIVLALTIMQSDGRLSSKLDFSICHPFALSTITPAVVRITPTH